MSLATRWCGSRAIPINLWPALVRYCGGGAIERRNYLFAGAAAMYSLIGTAKLNGSIPKPGCAMC